MPTRASAVRGIKTCAVRLDACPLHPPDPHAGSRAEEILREIKKIEFCDHTNGVRIGERFYIYAAVSGPEEVDLRGYSKLCKTRKERGQDCELGL